jgi:site-specific DNA recombinase
LSQIARELTSPLRAGAERRLTSLIRLSHLAPEILGALLAVRHPIELMPTRLLRLSKNLAHDWKEQRRFLGFAA